MNLLRLFLHTGLLLTLMALVSCQKDSIENQTLDTKNVAHTKSEQTLEDGLTTDFQQWLNNNGYGAYDFKRNDIIGGSFGGKIYESQKADKQPVIFIHGNSDKALGTLLGQSGWSASRDYFANNGYNNAEMYGFTWGPANSLQSAYQYHSYAYLSQIRAFIQAVADYTGAAKVDVICHSMGVTLARKAIKGGSGYDAAVGNYNLGNSMSELIDTFVGIAGANHGLVSCYQINGATPTCDNQNGFYPGYLVWGFGPYGVSEFLQNLNASSGYEGDYVYSIWSTADEVIGWSNLVYGKYTSRIPAQTGEKVYHNAPYGHFNLKDLTGNVQLQMVSNHIIL